MRLSKILIVLSLMLLFFLAGGQELLAQCPMCRATAESNLANGGSEGQGLNRGILYLFFAPYLIVGTVAFLWWRNRIKHRDTEEPAETIV